MKPWCVWCVKHKMDFVVYLVWWLFLPVFILSFIPLAFNEWLYENKSIAAAIRSMK